jgi:hypothetical protein
MKTTMVKIENWFITGSNDPYTPPECQTIHIKGFAFGHPDFPDGESIRTSFIESVEGRKVTTRSGRVYQLGKIDPGYRKHLKKIRPNWNWRKPITIKSV